MDTLLAAQVRHRANGRCEYCGLQQAYSRLRFQIDHIIPRQHRGSDDEANLALACLFCNSHKGPNLTGIDPLTGTISRLFHPRDDRWEDHFAKRDALLLGITDVGRTTIVVLVMNHPVQISLRQTMLDEQQANEQK